MTAADKGTDWAALVKAVRTPLGFFTLLALIFEALLIAASTATPDVPLWAPIGVLAFMFAAVILVAWNNPLALYHPSDWPRRPVLVNLLFPEDGLDLDIARCEIEIRDKLGQKKANRVPNLALGHGGWALHAPDDVEPTDTVRLELVETHGRRWRIPPFRLYEKEVTAALVTSPE
jgi:hypothetical protein